MLITEGPDGVRRPLLGRVDLDDAMSGGRWERHDVPLRACTPAADATDTGESDLVGDLAAATHEAAPASDAIVADVVIVPFASDDPELGGLIVITDNAERDCARERSAWQASHDPLTGLANRALVTERIESALARARGNGEWPAVLFIDLDRFRPVNDLHGHAFGDRLLVAVGANGCNGASAAPTPWPDWAVTSSSCCATPPPVPTWCRRWRSGCSRPSPSRSTC